MLENELSRCRERAGGAHYEREAMVAVLSLRSVLSLLRGWWSPYLKIPMGGKSALLALPRPTWPHPLPHWLYPQVLLLIVVLLPR